MTDTPVDWTDPCQRAAALTSAYYKLLSGDQEIEIQTRTLDAQEKVRFAPTDLNTLRSEMYDAQTACQAATQTGQPQLPTRFAITARFKRHPRRYDPFRGCY